ncbi:MAG: Hsp20/alpha crystallin family protein [Patescibacteria group bacterium]
MAIIRFNQFPQSWLRPLMWQDEEYPDMTMTDGLNVYEESNKVYVEASVPGIPEDRLDITYEDGVLKIAGRYEEKEEEKKKNRVVHKMQRVTSFSYTTYLPRAIDEKKLEAVVKDGVLTVSAPVADAAKARKIQVKKSSK